MKTCKQHGLVNPFQADWKAGTPGRVDRLCGRSFFTRVASLLAGAVMFSAAAAVAADVDYPNQAVKWIVPYSAGASNDSVARILAARLTQMWNQPVIIENKAGAGGTIGAAQAARAPADGYTLLMTNPGSSVNAFALRESNSYAQEDFKHVGQLGWAPIVLVTRSDFAGDSVKDLVALAKQEPGSLAAGSSGIGGSSHLALELFKLKSGTEILHVPYKGAANAINDLVGGQIDMVFVTPASVSSLVQSGKLKMLGVASEQRIDSAPEVPTMQEQDVPGFNMKIWFGISVPAATPDSIVNRLNQDMRVAVQNPQVKAQIEALGLQLEASSPQAFAQTIERDIALTRDIAAAAGITVK